MIFDPRRAYVIRAFSLEKYRSAVMLIRGRYTRGRMSLTTLHCDLLNNQSQLFEIRSSKEIRPIVSLILSEIVFRCEIKQRFDSVSLCTRFDSVEGRVRTILEHDQRTIVTFVFLFIVNKCDLHVVDVWIFLTDYSTL